MKWSRCCYEFVEAIWVIHWFTSDNRLKVVGVIGSNIITILISVSLIYDKLFILGSTHEIIISLPLRLWNSRNWTAQSVWWPSGDRWLFHAVILSVDHASSLQSGIHVPVLSADNIYLGTVFSNLVPQTNWVLTWSFNAWSSTISVRPSPNILTLLLLIRIPTPNASLNASFWLISLARTFCFLTTKSLLPFSCRVGF